MYYIVITKHNLFNRISSDAFFYWNAPRGQSLLSLAFHKKYRYFLIQFLIFCTDDQQSPNIVKLMGPLLQEPWMPPKKLILLPTLHPFFIIPACLCLLLSTSLPIRHHTSCSPFHTVIQSVWGLCFPPPPHGSLFLLQPLFLWVRLVPPPLLHQLLVRSQPAVGQSHSFLLLIQGQCQCWEVVHVLGVLPERLRGNWVTQCDAPQSMVLIKHCSCYTTTMTHILQCFALCGWWDERLRERVFLPQQFGGQRLIDRLLLALRSTAPSAALNNLGTLYFFIPRTREDVMSLAPTVCHHTCHLKKAKGNQKIDLSHRYYREWRNYSKLFLYESRCITISFPPNVMHVDAQSSRQDTRKFPLTYPKSVTTREGSIVPHF